jgi:hypothetical protein
MGGVAKLGVGPTNFLTVADTAALDITGTLCVFAWGRKLGDLGGFPMGVIAKWNRTGNQRSYVLYVEAGVPDNVKMSVSETGSATVVSATGATNYANLDNWLFMAGTFEPSTAIRVYTGTKPGAVAQDAVNTTAIPPSIFSSSAPLEIGRGNIQVGTQTFRDDIGMVGILTVLPTLKQFNELSFGVNPRVLFPSGTVAYYRLYGAETPEFDLTAGGLTAAHNNLQTRDVSLPGLTFTKHQTSRLTSAISVTDTGQPYLYSMEVPPVRTPERIIANQPSFSLETVVSPPPPDGLGLDMGQPLPERPWRAVPYKT